MGPIAGQIVAGLAAQVAAGLAAQGMQSATGRPEMPASPPSGTSVNSTSAILLNARIDRLRTAMHALVAAETNVQIFDAMDGLRPQCSQR